MDSGILYTVYQFGVIKLLRGVIRHGLSRILRIGVFVEVFHILMDLGSFFFVIVFRCFYIVIIIEKLLAESVPFFKDLFRVVLIFFIEASHRVGGCSAS